MRLPSGPWDGAQPRTHVFAILRAHGVEVTPTSDNDFFELYEDDQGTTHVVYLPNPVLREMITWLYRNYGHCGFKITDLVAPKPKAN